MAVRHYVLPLDVAACTTELLPPRVSLSADTHLEVLDASESSSSRMIGFRAIKFSEAPKPDPKEDDAKFGGFMGIMGTSHDTTGSRQRGSGFGSRPGSRSGSGNNSRKVTLKETKSSKRLKESEEFGEAARNARNLLHRRLFPESFR